MDAITKSDTTPDVCTWRDYRMNYSIPIFDTSPSFKAIVDAFAKEYNLFCDYSMLSNKYETTHDKFTFGERQRFGVNMVLYLSKADRSIYVNRCKKLVRIDDIESLIKYLVNFEAESLAIKES